MSQRRQTQLFAVQVISSAVIAASVVTLVRHHKRARSAPAPSDIGIRPDSSPPPDVPNPPSSPDKQSRKAGRLIRLIEITILLALMIAIRRFGSLGTPIGIAIYAGGLSLLLGWTLFVYNWSSRAELLGRVRDLVGYAVLIGFTAQAIASTEDLMTRVLLLFVAFILFGLWLWASEWWLGGSRANLGAALLGGAVVAAAVLFTEIVVNAETRQDDVQFTIALQRDLTGADLYGRDLSEMHLFEKILRNADLREANLADAYLVKADLTGAWLNNANLMGVDLTDVTKLAGADLTEANLERADLTNTDFRGASLDKARFVGALQQDVSKGINFENVSLIGANLSRANFKNSDFSDANLADANLYEANFAGANLAYATLTGDVLIGTNLERANLRGVDLHSLDLRKARLREAILDQDTRPPSGFNANSASVYLMKPGAHLREADLYGQSLESLELMRADLREANLVGVHLRGANLSGADLRKANLDEADLTEVNLTGARLQGASLFGVDLRQANLRNVQLMGAQANLTTRWPRDFKPKSAGVRVFEPGD